MPIRDDAPSPASGTTSASNTAPPSSPWPAPPPTKNPPSLTGQAPPLRDARTPERPDAAIRRPQMPKLPSSYRIPDEHLLSDVELRAEAETRDFQRAVNGQKYAGLVHPGAQDPARSPSNYRVITSDDFRTELPTTASVSVAGDGSASGLWLRGPTESSRQLHRARGCRWAGTWPMFRTSTSVFPCSFAPSGNHGHRPWRASPHGVTAAEEPRRRMPPRLSR